MAKVKCVENTFQTGEFKVTRRCTLLKCWVGSRDRKFKSVLLYKLFPQYSFSVISARACMSAVSNFKNLFLTCKKTASQSIERMHVIVFFNCTRLTETFSAQTYAKEISRFYASDKRICKKYFSITNH